MRREEAVAGDAISDSGCAPAERRVRGFLPELRSAAIFCDSILDAYRIFQTDGAEDRHGRAPVGERRLEEVEADEDCEPDPIDRDEVYECGREQDHDSGHEAKCAFDGHCMTPSRVSGAQLTGVSACLCTM